MPTRPTRGYATGIYPARLLPAFQNFIRKNGKPGKTYHTSDVVLLQYRLGITQGITDILKIILVE